MFMFIEIIQIVYDIMHYCNLVTGDVHVLTTNYKSSESAGSTL